MEGDIRQIAEDLKSPAGNSPRFSSPDAINANREAFVEKCHDTWKRLHLRAIEEILTWDAFMRAETIARTRRSKEDAHVGKPMQAFGKHNLAIWRKVNDSIVWSILGLRRHVIKRLCLYKERTYLSESNAESVLDFLNDVNASPLKLALWNDATSCIDIGDVTVIENGLAPHPRFLELKEGRVNDDILELFDKGEEDLQSGFTLFFDKYGKKGFDQIDRVIRQKVTADQAIDLLNNDKGIDPVTGREMKVMESPIPEDFYDHKLNEVLKEACRTKKDAISTIDGCLWVFANANKYISRAEAIERFTSLLNKRISGCPLSRSEKHPSWDKGKLFGLDDMNLRRPLAKPLFVRNLDSDIIASVIAGDLSRRVFLYFDWDGFARLIDKAGATFKWSSEKKARQSRAGDPRLRPPIIYGRIPEVYVGEVCGHITDPNLVEMLCDGKTPNTMAIETVAALQHIYQQYKSGEYGPKRS